VTKAPLVAIQDGDGDWVALTDVDGVYHSAVTNARYAVVVACTSSDSISNVVFYYRTVSDPTKLTVPACPPVAAPPAATAAISVTMTGAAGQVGEVWLGDKVVLDASETPRTITVNKGPVDVLALLVDDGTSGFLPSRMYRGATLDLEFDQAVEVDIGTSGLPPETIGLTVGGIDGSNTVGVWTFYTSLHASTYWMLQQQTFHREQRLSYLLPDAHVRQPGDLALVRAEIYRGGTDGFSYSREATVVTADSVAQTLQLPTDLVVAAPALDAAKDPRATFTLPIVPAMLAFVEHHVIVATVDISDPGSNAPFRQRDVLLSTSWVGDRSSVTLTTPDLSGLPGWTTSMALVPAYGLLWQMEQDERDTPFGTPLASGQRTISRMAYTP
jgi:hypothetical protein